MKRVIVGVGVALLLVAAGGAGWWFFLRGVGTVRPSAYLPADTVAYVEIPDGTKTFLHYQGSKLRRIVEHPEARQLGGGLAALVRQAIPDAAGAADAEALGHLRKAGSEFGLALGGTSFLAVTKVDLAPPAAGAAPDPQAVLRGIQAVGGFHDSPDGGSHVDALVGELGALWKAAPAAVSGTHGAATYTYVELSPSAGGVRLCRARWKGWDLFSLGEAPLFDFLDRAASATPPPSLRDAPNFAATVPKVAAGADVVSYCAFDSLWALYARWMAAVAPQANANAGTILDKLRFMKAAAGGAAFRDGDLVGRSVLLAPEAERGALGGSYRPIPLASLRFTTPDTVLYFAQSFDPELQYGIQKQTMAAMAAPAGGAAGPAPSPFDQIEKQVAAQGLDLHENLLRATGPELALVVDWPANQTVPDVLLLLGVSDAAKFGPFYDKYAALATATLGMMAKAETFQAGGYKAVSFAPPMAPWATPTLFDGADFWGLSLTASGAKRLLAAPGGGLTAAGLAGSARVPGKTTAALFLKTGAVVARSYAAGRPALAAYLKTTDAGRAVADQLPADPQLPSLLGELRSVGTADGDFIYHSSASPDGGLALVGVALGGFEAVTLGRKASVAPVPPPPAPMAPPAAAPPAP